MGATGSLRVDGEVKGTITAHKDVSLSSRGRVEADIQANTALAIAEGAVFIGTSVMGQETR